MRRYPVAYWMVALLSLVAAGVSAAPHSPLKAPAAAAPGPESLSGITEGLQGSNLYIDPQIAGAVSIHDLPHLEQALEDASATAGAPIKVVILRRVPHSYPGPTELARALYQDLSPGIGAVIVVRERETGAYSEAVSESAMKQLEQAASPAIHNSLAGGLESLAQSVADAMHTAAGTAGANAGGSGSSATPAASVGSDATPVAVGGTGGSSGSKRSAGASPAPPRDAGPSASPSHTVDWIAAAILILVLFAVVHRWHARGRRRSGPGPETH